MSNEEYKLLSWLYAELKWAVSVLESSTLRQKIKRHFIHTIPASQVIR